MQDGTSMKLAGKIVEKLLQYLEEHEPGFDVTKTQQQMMERIVTEQIGLVLDAVLVPVDEVDEEDEDESIESISR